MVDYQFSTNLVPLVAAQAFVSLITPWVSFYFSFYLNMFTCYIYSSTLVTHHELVSFSSSFLVILHGFVYSFIPHQHKTWPFFNFVLFFPFHQYTKSILHITSQNIYFICVQASLISPSAEKKKEIICRY